MQSHHLFTPGAEDQPTHDVQSFSHGYPSNVDHSCHPVNDRLARLNGNYRFCLSIFRIDQIQFIPPYSGNRPAASCPCWSEDSYRLLVAESSQNSLCECLQLIFSGVHHNGSDPAYVLAYRGDQPL